MSPRANGPKSPLLTLQLLNPAKWRNRLDSSILAVAMFRNVRKDHSSKPERRVTEQRSAEKKKCPKGGTDRSAAVPTANTENKNANKNATVQTQAPDKIAPKQNVALMLMSSMKSIRSDDEENRVSIDQGSYVTTHGGTKWQVNGYSSIEPDPDFKYFSGLGWGPKAVNDNSYNYTESKVISAFIPCYTESGHELQRTVRSLHRQRLPPGWRIEAVIVMDGADHISPSMSEYLSTLFGVKFNTNDPDSDPFHVLPGAETIIIEPTNQVSALTRTPVMENTVGGYTLVVKKQNRRKPNSQMWWLGSHSSILNSKYCLATDCGTFFARSATIHLIRRLDAELDLQAVTGLQRVLTSEMQGDGSWEIFNKPFSYLLRMLQRYEFEVSFFVRRLH